MTHIIFMVIKKKKSTPKEDQNKTKNKTQK